MNEIDILEAILYEVKRQVYWLDRIQGRLDIIIIMLFINTAYIFYSLFKKEDQICKETAGQDCISKETKT